MAHGCPVVSSNATCLPEIYDDAAHFFDPEDVNDMAQKIAEVLVNKNLRSALIERGSAQVKKYSWRRMAEQTLKVYKNQL
jgi:glycosyltransferase involved in cell wall biosynthesis